MDKPFKSDGCSVVADLDVGMRLACAVHDWAYYLGGTEEERSAADKKFASNIWRWSEYRLFAGWRWLGVRLFGAKQYKVEGISWGFGWIDHEPREPDDGSHKLESERPKIAKLLGGLAGEDPAEQWKLKEALKQVGAESAAIEPG